MDASHISDVLFLVVVGLLLTLVVVPVGTLVAEEARRRGSARLPVRRRAILAGRNGLLPSGPTVDERQISMGYKIDYRWPPQPMRHSHGRNRRRHARIGTAVRGFLALDRTMTECEILDVSLGGARVRASEQIKDQAHLTLGFGPFGRLVGEVVWRNRGVMGIRYVDSPQVVRRTLSGFLPQDCMAAS